MKACLILVLLLQLFSVGAQDPTRSQLVQQHARELDSAGAQFKGFSFLDSLLVNKRIVMLGESSHGTEEYSKLKFQLIRYLHEKLGYEVLLFESPMTNASYMPFANDKPGDAVKYSIQSVWHTQTVSDLFGYVKKSGMQFAGFDPQFMVSPYPALLYDLLLTDHPTIIGRFMYLEASATATIHNPGAYLSMKKIFSGNYASIADSLLMLSLSPQQRWLQQMAATNAGYYARIEEGDQRDSCMAKNIIWLANNLYAGKKIIVWAHNTHINKNPDNKRIMGKLLAAHFKEQLFGIGLYMQNGTTALNNRKVIDVKPAPGRSVEALLLATGFTKAFMPTGFPAFNRKMPTLHWGKDNDVLNPFKSYDAVILVNGVHAPSYLE